MKDVLNKLLEKLKDLDRELLNPKRLAILVVLYATGPKTVSQLVKITGLKWSEVDLHLRRLREQGLVEMRKGITAEGIRTVVSLTPYGVKVFEEIVKVFEEVGRAIKGSEDKRVV